MLLNKWVSVLLLSWVYKTYNYAIHAIPYHAAMPFSNTIHNIPYTSTPIEQTPQHLAPSHTFFTLHNLTTL